MRVLVCGGGPAGLFFGLLLKRRNPKAEISVVEQNEVGQTYGWGVGFTDRALEVLAKSAPDVIERFKDNAAESTRIDVSVEDVNVPLSGFKGSVIGRATFLGLLQSLADQEGIELRFGSQIEEFPDASAFDLVVGADGVNSRLRSLLPDAFNPTVSYGRNWFAWYGAKRGFDATSIRVRSTPNGIFIAHASTYAPQQSNFLVEVGDETYNAMGFSDGDVSSSMALCEEVFSAYLEAGDLVSSRSIWFRAKFVGCERWVHENVVLIGDAAHTVHPSIGAGTRLAMRDAVYLVEALEESEWNVGEGLNRYVVRRKPVADGLQRSALRSIAWYDGLPLNPPSDPYKFALEYAMRTGQVHYPTFRAANPDLFNVYESLGRR